MNSEKINFLIIYFVSLMLSLMIIQISQPVLQKNQDKITKEIYKHNIIYSYNSYIRTTWEIANSNCVVKEIYNNNNYIILEKFCN